MVTASGCEVSSFVADTIVCKQMDIFCIDRSSNMVGRGRRGRSFINFAKCA